MIRPALVLLAIALPCALLTPAQQVQSEKPAASSVQDQVISDQDIALLRQNIRSQRKQIIAQNMTLTDAEAQQFWPVYDRYVADLAKINDVRVELIKQYAQSYDTLTEEQADKWIDSWLKVDQDVATLRRSYLTQFRKILPAKKTALYEQLDRRTQLMIDMQLASQVPLIPVRR